MNSARVALVTGSASGIGQATAIALARGGDHVIASVRDPSRAEILVAMASEARVELDIRPLDVTDEGSVHDAVAGVRADYGGIDLVVNNAGVGVAGTLEEVSPAALRQAMEVNFFGVATVTRAVVPMMRENGGRLIAVSSIAGVFGQPFNDGYCASKFALEGLYEALHPVLATFGIRVSLVEAGPVAGMFREKSVGVDSQHPQGPYADLWTRFRSVADAAFDASQTPDDVAKVIVEVSRDEPPRLRYQTSAAVEKLVGMKLADVNGERVARMTSRWLS